MTPKSASLAGRCTSQGRTQACRRSPGCPACVRSPCPVQPQATMHPTAIAVSGVMGGSFALPPFVGYRKSPYMVCLVWSLGPRCLCGPSLRGRSSASSSARRVGARRSAARGYRSSQDQFRQGCSESSFITDRSADDLGVDGRAEFIRRHHVVSPVNAAATAASPGFIRRRDHPRLVGRTKAGHPDCSG